MPKVPSRKKTRPQPKDNKTPNKTPAVPTSRAKHGARARAPPRTLNDFVVGDADAGTPSSSSPPPIGDVPEAVAPVGPQLQQSLVDAIKAGMMHLTTAIIEEQHRGMAEMKEAIKVALQQPPSQNHPQPSTSSNEAPPARAVSSALPPGAAEQAQVALPARAAPAEPGNGDGESSTPARADIIVPVHNTTQNSQHHIQITDSPNTVARPIQTAGLPVGAGIPLKTKEKVWNHQYVDLHDLMENNTDIYVLQLQHPNSTPELNFAPRKRKQLLTEMEWISAFNTYTALYLEKYPHELNAILSYSSTVQQIMTAGGDWRNYDTRYRQDREVTHCSWHTVRPDLEIQAYRRTNMQSFRSTTTNSFQRSTNQRQTGTPHGYCFAFHSPKAVCSRSPCQHKHTCHICNSRHPAYKCPSTSNKQTESDTPRETV